ncbi:isoleucine--tRNA ligase [Sporosarcina sp.]|uniref:isoleucine--tRNA ligase n=1 Tax=Sporosarcina sp. TaxID=49982 RepID=UPI0026333354|nr:isoleucine--tRNA ligase [Sporosarcina sp.]
MEYKDTLLMPKTEFPMRGNLPNNEPKMQEKWNEENIYKKVQERTAGRPFFILHDGPPYANGDLHMGHALNKVLKDFIVRYKSMSGFHAPYVPGWDTHGLPIEQALVNKGVDRKKMSIAEFRKMCEEYALEQISNQRTQFRRLGVRGDWENPYITLKPAFESRQIQVFGEMAKKGYIYKGLKPVYWSPSSESALAEAEIEYQDKKSPSIYVSFPVRDGKGVLAEDVKFLIWTTTPWTIPANLGISVHPAFTYAIVSVNGEKFVVAKDLVDFLAKELEWENYTIERELPGADLDRVVAKHPFYDRDSLVMLGEHVTADAGTGCVHTAPGHGEDDFYVSKSYGIDALSPINDRGVMTEEAPFFEGMFYEDANKAVTEKLKEVGALQKLSFITHSYPHDWRTKKPVIYRATAQWFASIELFRSDLLEAIRKTEFTPSWGETRLFNMVRDRGDWCISRQRVWGVPIPVFYAENGDAILTDETISHVAELFRENGSNIWFERSAKELLPEGFTHEGSPNGEFTKETDIMDVWFDSGTTHQGVLDERDDLVYPADLYLEGSDQYRGWFNSSLTTSVAINGIAPYKGVLSHGFTLDKDGRKMSKSLGNVIVPSKVINQLGADIVRLWVASVDYTADVRVSDSNFKQVSEVYRKIRNTIRFLHGNVSDFNPTANRVSFEDMRPVDQYVYVKLQDLIEEVTTAYSNYEFASVYHAVNNFCTGVLSSFYLDIAKDVVYIEGANHPHRRAMQSVMYDTLITLVKLITPILPHTADEMWNYLTVKEADSVQLTDMPKADQKGEAADKLRERFDGLMAIRDDVLKALEEARNAKVIGKSLEAKVTVVLPEDLQGLLQAEDIDFAQFFIVSAFEESKDADLPNALKLDRATVLVEKADGEKCERCWTISTTVGEDSEHPALCTRCADVVKENYA